MDAALEATRTVFSKYVTFQGRASRAELWWWILVYIIIAIVLTLLDASLFGIGDNDVGPLSGLFSLACLLPNLAVGARRLHDIGKSGWWLLISLIPIIGFLILIYFYVQPSEEGTNLYGSPSPLGSR